jgi:hypothetical protein
MVAGFAAWGRGALEVRVFIPSGYLFFDNTMQNASQPA